LTVRLVHHGEPDRVLEFHAATEGARVLGCAPTSDVVLRERGVLPVHCYFERERDDIWVSAARASAEIRVNYQPLAARIKLGRRSIVEVGAARLQIVVLEDDEDAPLHGPFGTEVIGLRLPDLVHLVDTTPVDASVALGELPTTAWKRVEIVESQDDDTLVTRSEHGRVGAPSVTPSSPEQPIDEASQLGAHPTAMVTALTTTERIPRDDLPAVHAVEPVQSVRPSRCILLETESRVVMPATVARGKSDDDTVPAVRARLRALGALQVPMILGEPSRLAAAPQASVNLECPAPITESEIVLVDAGIFTTIDKPIVETLAADSEAALHTRHIAPGPLSPFVAFRQRFAIRWGREPRVVAMIALAAALSLSALVSQAVRGWREIVEFATSVRDVSPMRAPAGISPAHPRSDRLTRGD
jgi:hypothetical protein